MTTIEIEPGRWDAIQSSTVRGRAIVSTLGTHLHDLIAQLDRSSQEALPAHELEQARKLAEKLVRDLGYLITTV